MGNPVTYNRWPKETEVLDNNVVNLQNQSSSSKKLPPFDKLVLNYPTTSDYKSVIRDINPKYENEPAYQNTCAMRLSKALNYCNGHEIPKKGGLYCIIGIDKKRYAIRVKEVKRYLRDTYGPPDYELSAIKGKIDKSKILNQKGIIAFDVTGWSDASGHFTLWNGTNLLYAGSHDYFNFYDVHPVTSKITQVTKAYLWVSGI